MPAVNNCLCTLCTANRKYVLQCTFTALSSEQSTFSRLPVVINQRLYLFPRGIEIFCKTVNAKKFSGTTVHQLQVDSNVICVELGVAPHTGVVILNLRDFCVHEIPLSSGARL